MAARLPAEDERLESRAHDYPRWPGESPIHYAERLAVLAGIMRREDAAFLGKDEDLEQRRPGARREIRLPYKD